MPALSRLANAGSVADKHTTSVCGDCGAILSDWILDHDGTCLCFACADHWEPYHQGEDAVLA